MAFTAEDDQVNPKSNFLYKLASKIYPVYPDEHSSKFFVKEGGKRYITVIFLALLVIESTDILFAFDSIPAIIGVIQEGKRGILSLEEENFLAISSNVFAVMGLRTLFFALKGILDMFRFLKHGVSFILLFIGLKMLLGFFDPVEEFFKEHSWVSLTIIVGVLVIAILLSMIIAKDKTIKEDEKRIKELENELKK